MNGTVMPIRITFLSLLLVSLFASGAFADDQVVNDCSNDLELNSDLAAMQNSGGGALTFACGPATILLESGVLPTITTNSTIDGGGQITISGRNLVRIMVVNPGGTLTLNKITLTEGFHFDEGGAVYNYGTLNINDSQLLNNRANSNGGAILNNAGILNLSNVTLSGNFAGMNGGGIAATASVSVSTVANAVFDGNISDVSGGAIYNLGTMSITDSTLSANSAVSRGGGISEFSGALNVTNTTFSGNSARSGGGIDNDSGQLDLYSSAFIGNVATAIGTGGGIRSDLSVAGSVKVINCTLSENSARVGGGIYSEGGVYSKGNTVSNSTISGNTATDGYGGGIYFLDSGTIKSTLIALNKGFGSPDLFGVVTSEGFNFVGMADGSIGFTASTDITGTIVAPLDPLLDSVAKNNGGPTLTIAILPGSPLIDQGTSTGLTGDLATDQRGFDRTANFSLVPNAIGGDSTDIGAFELQSTTTLTPPKLQNISTRLRVQTADNVSIGGFIILGVDDKKVFIRGIGPSLGGMGLAGTLADPTLELHDATGKIIASNDNWKSGQQAEIEATTIPPTDNLESAIIATLPGDGAAYTAILRGKNGATGIGLIEAYDLDAAANSTLANISTRGFVDTGDNIMIGGFILGGGSADVAVRAIGPSLTSLGIAGALQDPALDLYDSSGNLVVANDDWKETQQSEIEAAGIPPSNDRESAIVRTLLPGPYTALVRGKNDTTGVALIEVYELN